MDTERVPPLQDHLLQAHLMDVPVRDKNGRALVHCRRPPPFETQ
jgi:hypothetical protein